MSCSRNEVVLLPIPFTDLTSRKLDESGDWLSPLKDKIWRVGLMGETSSKSEREPEG
jgi:hypothetical protein